MIRKEIQKYLLIFLGTISLILGMIGVLIPVLPTTPFLLLASFCYIRSSKRLYDWLINHKLFGSYIYNYMTHRAVEPKAKITAITFLWTSLILSMVLVPILHLRLFLAAVGIGVSVHLLTLKTIRP